jgi:hypothetical protein
MFGDNIYILLKDIGKSDKHFDIYAEYIRKRDHPTAEEISERENRERRFQEQEEQEEQEEQAERRKIEREEQEKITNQYKASSRLERLKTKNNVC